MAVPFRFAICNEIFRQTPFGEVCKQVQALGYSGLEIAPHTLGEDGTLLSEQERNEHRRQMEDAEIEFVGLHWLLMSPPGLHITAADETIRKRTWEYVHRAIDLCGDLAGSKAQDNGLIVFGSPKQRSTEGLVPVRQAVDIFTHELAHAAAHAETRSVQLLVESLPSAQTDVVNSMADAVAIVKQIGSPAVQTMFDVHNAIEEEDSGPELVRRYFPYIRHVHVNEVDGREPGMGNYDFAALLSVLAELNYAGWVSLEAFDFSRDPREIARRSITHLKASAPVRAQAQSI